MSNIVFLFGAGVSRPANMPMTDDITEQILTARNVVRGSNDAYYIVAEPDLPRFQIMTEDFVPRVKQVVEYLSRLPRIYDEPPSSSSYNYEQIYFKAHEILNTILRNKLNPMFKPSADFISKEFDDLLGPLQPGDLLTWDPEKLFNETTKYIADIVRSMLWRPKSRLDHMSLLKGAFLDQGIDGITVATLNHDLLFEFYFKYNEIPFNDGFELQEQEVEFWESKKLFNESKVRLLKLHGSINWYSFEVEREEFNDYIVGKLNYGSFFLNADIPGINKSPLPNHALIIVGTNNKILEYHKYIFFDLQVQFFLQLRETSELFVSGYAFGDEWINRMILDWMRSNSTASIVIAHDDFEGLINGIDGFFSEWLKIWQNDRRLGVIHKMIQHVTWEEIKETFAYLESQRTI